MAYSFRIFLQAHRLVRRYSPRIDAAVYHAAHVAAAQQQPIQAWHLLVGLYQTEGSIARALLQTQGLTPQQLATVSPPSASASLGAFYAALAANPAPYLGTEHALRVILDDGTVAAQLAAWGIAPTALQQALP